MMCRSSNGVNCKLKEHDGTRRLTLLLAAEGHLTVICHAPTRNMVSLINWHIVLKWDKSNVDACANQEANI